MKASILIIGLLMSVAGMSQAVVAEQSSAAFAAITATITHYEHQLEGDPHSFIGAARLGEAYMAKARLTGALADYRKSEAAYRKSLAIMPQNNAGAEIGLAHALQSQHRFKDAKAVITKSLEKTPDNTDAWAIAGDIAFELGDYATAQLYHRKFAEKCPGIPAWSRQAKIALLFGRWDEAQKYWELCSGEPIGSDPEPHAWANVMFGELYLRAGRLEDARRHFATALEILPGYRLALEHQAESFEIEGDDKAAAPLLDLAIAQGDHADLLLRRAAICKRLGDPSEARLYRERAMALLEAENSGGDFGHRHALAEALIDQGRDVKRALILAQAESQERGDIGTDYLLARTLYANGLKADAVKHMQRALQYNSFEPGFYRVAIAIYSGSGRPDLAKEAELSLQRLNPALVGDPLADRSASR